MYEFHLTNLNTNEETIIFGRNLDKAFTNTNLNPAEWFVWDVEYID